MLQFLNISIVKKKATLYNRDPLFDALTNINNEHLLQYLFIFANVSKLKNTTVSSC